MIGGAGETNTGFDAPRPAVTNRMGKKRTDELIQADGDTWQEYLAVSEKINRAASKKSKRSGGLSSLFGRKKKEDTKSESNIDGNSTLVIRSYFENTRTGEKIWDEPPSGASDILPASEEMRRMAELQLNEVQVVVTPPAGIEDLNERNNSSNNGNTKKTLFGNTKNPKTAEHSGKRIRYKPGASSAVGSSSDGQSLNDRQLQEAIKRSMNETQGGAANSNVESEEEILRRVLEQSRLEAESSGSRKTDRYHVDEDDRKPAARKQPPITNMTSRRR